MVTVCRNEKLATKMTAFLETARKDLGPILDDGPYLGRSCTDWDQWYWQDSGYYTTEGKGTRIYSEHTHFMGIWRCANLAFHRFAALKIGRRRKVFTEKVRFSSPIPYIRYGDFENWPAITASMQTALPELKDKKFLDKVEWTFIKENGCHRNPGRANLYLGMFNPNSMELYKQAEHIERGQEHMDKVMELSTPWCTEVLEPLDSFMTNLSIEWEKE
jgi:hypothetical protein